MDLSVKEVRILKDSPLGVGHYNTEWDGKDDRGAEMPPGIYIIYCIKVDGSMVNKIINL